MKIIGTQWVNTNPTKIGFRIVHTRQVFEIEQTTDNGITWRYRATEEDIFSAVLAAVRWTEEEYKKTLTNGG